MAHTSLTLGSLGSHCLLGSLFSHSWLIIGSLGSLFAHSWLTHGSLDSLGSHGSLFILGSHGSLGSLIAYLIHLIDGSHG